MAKSQRHVSRSVRVQLEDISLSAESGWRPLCPIRVAELAQAFSEGQYLQTICTRPSVVGEELLAVGDLLDISAIHCKAHRSQLSVGATTG
jgi:hypothetical protein